MTSVNLSEMFGAEQTFPSCPDAALLLGVALIRLGGSFSIGSNGTRYVSRPVYSDDEELPQLPNAKPHETFHNAEQWEGAAKVLQGLIHRLNKDDKTYLFEMLAESAYDPRKLVPSIEEPKRRPA